MVEFAVLDVSTGLGLGVVSGGRVITGHKGPAGVCFLQWGDPRFLLSPELLGTDQGLDELTDGVFLFLGGSEYFHRQVLVGKPKGAT